MLRFAGGISQVQGLGFEVSGSDYRQGRGGRGGGGGSRGITP